MSKPPVQIKDEAEFETEGVIPGSEADTLQEAVEIAEVRTDQKVGECTIKSLQLNAHEDGTHEWYHWKAQGVAHE